MSFTEIYQTWLREKQQQVRPTTLAAYTYIADHHLLPHFGKMEVVTTRYLQQYVNTMHAQGMSRNSLNNILSVMRMVLRFGEEQGWCSVPEGKLRLPPNTPTGKLQVMSVREEEKFVRFLLGKDSPLDVALLTGMTTGMRLGELCGLQAGDLLLERQLCQVNRTVAVTYDREARRTYLSVNLPKTPNSIRDIPLHPVVVQCIKTLLQAADYRPDAYLFTASGQPLHPNHLRKHFRQTLRNLRLPPLHFHALRHTFATRCIESGCDVKTLSAILGHSSVQTTLNLYVHPSMQQKQQALLNMMQLVMGREKL